MEASISICTSYVSDKLSLLAILYHCQSASSSWAHQHALIKMMIMMMMIRIIIAIIISTRAYTWRIFSLFLFLHLSCKLSRFFSWRVNLIGPFYVAVSFHFTDLYLQAIKAISCLSEAIRGCSNKACLVMSDRLYENSKRHVLANERLSWRLIAATNCIGPPTSHWGGLCCGLKVQLRHSRRKPIEKQT